MIKNKVAEVVGKAEGRSEGLKVEREEVTIKQTRRQVMRKLLLVAAVAAGLVGMALVADAATNIVNICTSTYELTGQAAALSGWDTAIVRAQTPPSIQVAKYAKNLRTGIEDAYQVQAVSGDTIEFTIVWSNVGEADADTVVLNDYIPAGLTYVAGSVSDTEVNASGAATESGGLIQYNGTAAKGTDGGTPADGIIRFQATVN